MYVSASPVARVPRWQLNSLAETTSQQRQSLHICDYGELACAVAYSAPVAAATAAFIIYP